jgi:ribosomal protein S18 acetylase RimI-like enzyme
VIATLGSLTRADVRQLARVHQEAFPRFFLSNLGQPFLMQFYRGFLADESAVTVVARGADGTVLGAAVGTTEPAVFFRRMMKSRWLGFVPASAFAVLRNPKAAPRLLRVARYGGDVPATAKGGALLSSICVDPSLQAAGVGRLLLDAWTSEVASRGVQVAFLTTDADDNDLVNRFYQVRGWVLAERYTTREGRSMNRYVLSLDAPS